MHTRATLAADFTRLGVRAGDTIMLHASIRAVGPIAGGPDEIHLALKDALGPTGTLLMYASVPDGVDDIGRGELSETEEVQLRTLQPAFDPETARCARDNGALVELFRTWPGSLVNHHPVRFVSWGARAEWLLGPQPWHFAYGRESVLSRFADAGGRILMLGSDHDTVTFLHHVEHIADIPDPRVVTYEVPMLEHGARVWKQVRELDSSAGAHRHWSPRFFAEVVDTFLSHTGATRRAVGHASSWLMDACALRDFAQPIMEAVSRDISARTSLAELPPDLR
jgi:aminoglycoside 3-N-acetyltransferase